MQPMEVQNHDYVDAVRVEYGDMQLIAEGYQILSQIGGLTNDELHDVGQEVDS